MTKFSHLNLPDGITKPYRPKPANFREIYLEMGWDGIDEYFHTNWRVIRRWIEEEGRDELIAERRRFVLQRRRHNQKNGSKPFRYVAGRTLGGSGKSKKKG